jgi:PAS domain S-box-containing protein
MVSGFRSLFRLRPIAEELGRQSRALLLSRMRTGIVLALFFIPSFIPLDYFRMPEHFAWAMVVRLSGCGLLLVLLSILSLKPAEPWAEWFAAFGVSLISGTVLGVARFSHGAADPVYLVQAMAIIFLIMGAALLLPLEGRWILLLGSIPLVMQALMTLHFEFLENLPILASGVIALVVAVVGAQSAFLARLGDYEGQRAKEALLEARSEIVTMLTHDVEQRKKNEEVLRKSEQKYRTLFEEYRDGLVLASAGGRILDANSAALALFGYVHKEEFLALRTYELFYARRDLERVRLARLLVANDFSLRDVEIDCKHRSGRRLNVVVSSSPLRDEEGQIVGFRTVVRDVTERRLLEARLRQTQKLEAVGMLAAGVAHEINNPLTYVITNLQMMQADLRQLTPTGPGTLLVDAFGSRVNEACEGAERVRHIVRDLKTFARLDEEERGAVEVAPLLVKSIKLAGPEIRYRARVRQEIAPVPPVVGNEGRLSQVFVNLLINAAQAMEEGAVERNEIRVRTSATEREVQVEVADTGKGIAPEHLDRLFDPFFTTKSTSGGSGLGLSICYNIVTSYGGRIEVESKLGAGSRFVLHLPIERTPRAVVIAEKRPLVASRHGRVLVVDDEPFVVSAIQIILARTHDFVGVASGAEALKILEYDDRFDVILCDLMMQQGSGMDLYNAIARRQPELARRMLFMTGGAYTQHAQRFLAAVPNPCIEKPFGPAELVSVVEQVMAGGTRRDARLRAYPRSGVRGIRRRV